MTDEHDKNARVSRRAALQGLGAVSAAALAACGSENGTATTGAGGGGGSGAGGDDAGSTSRSSSASSSQGDGGAGGGEPVDHCASNGGLTPEELLGSIDTFVVLCMENRSFDHYFGSLTLLEGRTDVDGLKGDEYNLDPNGKKVPIFKLTNFTPADPPHDWDPVHVQWGNGNLDGFVIAHAGPNQQEVMGFHTRDQIPVSYALADGYALCDKWFSACLGPTWSNRYYLHGGTAKGQQKNQPVTGFTSIFSKLTDKGITFRNFYGDIPWSAGAYFEKDGHVEVEELFYMAAKGTLPQVSVIDPIFLSDGANDDHPDHNIQLGQALIASIYKALSESPQWDRMMFIITYDEHGGFYDHVPPPETPDDDPDFRVLGFRVPTLVLGPRVKRGCVVHDQFEHSSIVHMLCKRFGIEPLNARVAQTNDLSSTLDGSLIGKPAPPPVKLAPFEVSAQKFANHRTKNLHHTELIARIKAGAIAPGIDRSGRSREISWNLVEIGERLGALKITK